MTDYTKLIERLDTELLWTLNYEAQDAIQALQEENALLEGTLESRERNIAALQSAIEALQKEVSTLDVLLEECKMDWSGDVTQLKAEHKREIDALQSKLGDAIQSSAHWQHQFTEAQAENEQFRLLAKANSEALGAALAERDQLQAENERLKEQIDCFVNGQNQLFEVAKILEDERDALESKLDAMGKGEPIYQYLMADGRWIDQAKQSYDYNRNNAPHAVMRIVYAALKEPTP